VRRRRRPALTTPHREGGRGVAGGNAHDFRADADRVELLRRTGIPYGEGDRGAERDRGRRRRGDVRAKRSAIARIGRDGADDREIGIRRRELEGAAIGALTLPRVIPSIF
jgi:hypothetical protein